MTKKYSSFKKQQTLTENFRRFLNLNEAGFAIGGLGTGGELEVTDEDIKFAGKTWEDLDEDLKNQLRSGDLEASDFREWSKMTPGFRAHFEMLIDQIETPDELDMQGHDASEQQMDWARDGMEELGPQYIDPKGERYRKAKARQQQGDGALEEEAERTAKGNITQATREKYATVGKDGFPIFDKKSAIAAIDLRGHASEADQKKIIDKAAKFAPKEAEAAREKDKGKSEGRLRKNSGKKIVVEISRRKKKGTRR